MAALQELPDPAAGTEATIAEVRTWLASYRALLDDFHVADNGMLLYHPADPSCAPGTDRLVVPQPYRLSALVAMHDEPVSGGHMAVRATLRRLEERYWWPDCRYDCKIYAGNCTVCQQMRTPHQHPPHPVRNPRSQRASRRSQPRLGRASQPDHRG